MRTSFEAVNNIVGNVSSKDNVWNVNDKKDADESKAYNSALLSGEGEYRGNYVPLQKKIEENPDEKKEVVQPRRLRRPMMTPIKKADPEGKLSEPIILDNSVVIAARPDKTIPIEETAAEDADNAAVIDVIEGGNEETSGNENDVLIFEPVDKYAELLKDNEVEETVSEQVEEVLEVVEETPEIVEEVAEELVEEEPVVEETIEVTEEPVVEETFESAEETVAEAVAEEVPEEN